MEVVTAINARRLCKQADVTDLSSLATSLESLVELNELDVSWAIYHCFKELNKRYFYAYGAPLYQNHDGGFSPLPSAILGPYLLAEDGSYILDESGGRIILE